MERDQAARRRLTEAADFAVRSPLPAPETACDGVFAERNAP